MRKRCHARKHFCCEKNLQSSRWSGRDQPVTSLRLHRFLRLERTKTTTVNPTAVSDAAERHEEQRFSSVVSVTKDFRQPDLRQHEIVDAARVLLLNGGGVNEVTQVLVHQLRNEGREGSLRKSRKEKGRAEDC